MNHKTPPSAPSNLCLLEAELFVMVDSYRSQREILKLAIPDKLSMAKSSLKRLPSALEFLFLLVTQVQN